jgi:hypothetical protein
LHSDRSVAVRRVAFGEFADWKDMLVSDLDTRFAASFVDLAQIDPAAFDAVVPLQLFHYEPLARHGAMRGRKFFHPSPQTVSLCDDKLALAAFLTAQGFGRFVPPPRAPGAPYPYLRKRRRGWNGEHCRIVNGPQDETDPDDEEWFAQAFVPGHYEFATHILRAGGHIRYASTFAYKMATPTSIKGAHDKPRETLFMRGCNYLSLFAEILARLDYEGTACIDYKVFDGRPILFEVNPRCGSSLCQDVNAYLDAYLAALEKTGH